MITESYHSGHCDYALKLDIYILNIHFCHFILSLDKITFRNYKYRYIELQH